MSEVDARPPPSRGRSSYRGGRGGSGRGGPRGGRKPTNGAGTDSAQFDGTLGDQGELGEMKQKYASELVMLKDMFPDWTDVDLAFALQEADGDVPSTVDHITQGNVSQFAEVKSAKDRARSKVKEPTPTAGAADKAATRGTRGRGGTDSTRGGRGRGSERGRGGLRGARGGHATTNGTTQDVAAASVPTTESTAWDDSTSASTTEGAWGDTTQDPTKDAGGAGQSAWSNVVTSDKTPATASEGAKSSLIPEGGPKKSWASMFAPKPAPPAVKKATTQPPVDVAAKAPDQNVGASIGAPVPAIQEPAAATSVISDASTPEQPPSTTAGEELTLTPSQDPLTEENVEHLPDESIPPSTLTVASTAGSMDPRNLTPLPGAPAPISRPPLGGYATSAYRATGGPGRSASFQRRVQEQQEAVVMPGHNAVDRAAVQFGSMGLNGEPGPDVDEEREDPETRQAPQQSPPALPRTSLPPAPRHAGAAHDTGLPESLPTPKQAPGLPPASQQNQQQMQQDVSLPPGIPAEQAQMHNYAQYGRYGQPSMQQDSGAQQQKPYDPFSHQAQHSQYDQFGAHVQQPPQPQQTHSGFGGLSSAPSDFSSYYTADQVRGQYSNYYGSSYGPQDVRSQIGQGSQDAGLGQQRSTSGFGTGPNESAFSSQAQQQAQSRFADQTNSGHTTPNPLMGGPQQGGQQPQHAGHQGHQGGYGGAGGYQYGHPYYGNPYQQAYQSQYGYNQQLGGYGGGYPSKHSGMYGGSHGYGMGPQSSYDQHSASPANAGAFGHNQQSSMRSASGMSSGLGSLDDYGRSSAQPQSQQPQASGGFGGMNDAFTRSASGFGGAQQQSAYGQQSMAGPEDTLKPFADNKSGPSPALGQPGNRPGSAANNNAQSGLPPPQSHQSGGGFGGYGGFPGQSQYGGLGGLGNQQQQQQGQSQQGGYGSYGAGGFNQYGGYSRGGWASNYGAH